MFILLIKIGYIRSFQYCMLCSFISKMTAKLVLSLNTKKNAHIYDKSTEYHLSSQTDEFLNLFFEILFNEPTPVQSSFVYLIIRFQINESLLSR